MAKSAGVFNQERPRIGIREQASNSYMVRSVPRRQGEISQDENIREEPAERNEVDNQTTIAQLLELRIQLA
jgi:hypothetical protein